ncbi:hypothetical protein N9I98_01080 [Flavobacteriales bacterium]|nr:hypothetical protein [Flavobacteriales bacterium]
MDIQITPNQLDIQALTVTAIDVIKNSEEIDQKRIVTHVGNLDIDKL